jgi:hypothetical protein
VGIIETSAALGACLLVLTVAVALDRRPYYIPIDHRARRVLGPRAASPEFDGV